MLSKIPNSELLILNGAGHEVHEESVLLQSIFHLYVKEQVTKRLLIG
ncbi:MAG: hypothetical protein ACK5IQ_08580 [Bacteroidales bacterium]